MRQDALYAASNRHSAFGSSLRSTGPAWGMTLAAHLFAVVGVALGIFSASRSGAGGEANFIYHRVILVVLLLNLVLLITPAAKAALGRKIP